MIENRPTIEELEKAQSLAEEGVELALGELSKDEEVRIGFGWTEDDFTKEYMNGVRGLGWNSGYFEIEFNAEIEGWKKAVLGTAVHEFAHAYFSEQKGLDENSDKPIWMYILEEGLTQNITEKLVPESLEPWRYEHSIGEISEYWAQIKEDELDRQYTFPDPLYIDRDDEKYPNWLGYSLSYQIGQKLLENNEIENFTALTKQDLIDAGDEIFDEQGTGE